MVLFPSDYEELYNDKGRESALALLAFKFLIFSKTFLFIGTGLDDHQINSIFKEIKEIRGVYNQEHYIITLDSLDNSLLNFLTPIPVGSYTKIPKVIKQLIEIKQAAEANKSSEKKKLLDQLKEVKERNISLTKELDKEKDKRQARLLKREANNHFYTGVKHHLDGEYLEASKEYEAATELNPKDFVAYYNWGVALSRLAQSKSGIDAEALYNESFEKYRQATQIKPDVHEVYYNWGVALSDLAQSKSGIEAENLYAEAIDKYQQAIKYGGSTYNLACLYAIRNKKEEALKYLERSLERGKISVDFVEKATDWDGLRDDSDFKNLLSRYKKDNKNAIL